MSPYASDAQRKAIWAKRNRNRFRTIKPLKSMTNKQDEPKLRLRYNDIEKRSSTEGRPRIFRNGKQVGFGAREPEEGFYEV